MYKPFRHILLWLTLLVASTFCSCAELIEFNDPIIGASDSGSSSTLPFQELYIMVGDSCKLDLQVPDSLSMTYYCDSYSGESLVMKGRSIYAVQPGDQVVTVHIRLFGSDTIDEKSFDCLVHVFDWQADNLYADYPYSMILYCQIAVDGAALSDQMEVAALSANGEVRGRAQWLEDGQIRYICLRIYSPKPQGEEIYLYCYDHTRVQRISLLDAPLIFDGETHGTLSNLLQITGSFATQ